MKNIILHRVKCRLSHLFKSGYWRGHHVHSPFMYHFIRHVVTTHNRDEKLRSKLKLYRKQMSKSNVNFDFIDLGTGKNGKRSVKQIAKNTAIEEKYGLLLARIVSEYKPATIIELGTSIGFSTYYLSQATNNIIHTIEGCPQCLAFTEQNLSQLGISNVKYHCGDFIEILPKLLKNIEMPLVAFIDGNHTYNATIQYFNLFAQNVGHGLAILIFDDIHWSPEMTKAWSEIVVDKRVMNTVDIYQMGIAIFRSNCQKEHFVLRW